MSGEFFPVMTAPSASSMAAPQKMPKRGEQAIFTDPEGAVFGGVGERSREGNDLWREMKESGVLPQTVMVFGQMNEPPGSRMRVARSPVRAGNSCNDTHTWCG